MSDSFPAIPFPDASVEALYDSVMALKQSVEMLAGQTYDDAMKAIRIVDLPSAIIDAINSKDPTGDAKKLTDYLISLHQGAVKDLQLQINAAKTAADTSFAELNALLSLNISDLNAKDADLQTQINVLAAGGGDAGAAFAAQIASEAAARASADDALAIRVDTIETTSGFDAAVIWNFESTVEGWSGNNLTLAAVDGKLVLTQATSTDQNLISPIISVDGAKFDRVRMRIRRTAGTSWQGTCYYSTSGHGFSESYKKAIPTPTAALNSWFLIDLDMYSLSAGGTDWKTNTITRLQFDLADGSTGDVFEIDWLAVGRLGGASTALITQEAVARVTADSALSGRVDTVTASVGSNTSAITALQSARAATDETVAATLNTITSVTGGIRSFSQSTPPVSPNAGDVWIDTGNGGQIKYYQNGAWQSATSTGFVGSAAAISQEAITRSTADSATTASINSLSSLVAGNSAAITTELSTRASADSALSGQISTVQSNVNTQAARIDSEIVTRANADSALSSTLTAVQAQSNAGTANGSYRLTATSASAGVAAEFAAQVALTAGGSYTSAGMNLQVLSGGGSRIVFNSDQFIVKNNAVNYTPFAIVNSNLYGNFLITSANLAAGVGSNQLYNSTFNAGTDGYIFADGNWVGRVGPARDINSTFTLPSGHTLACYSNTLNQAVGNYFDLDPRLPDNSFLPITPGKRYELSAYYGAHRCHYVTIMQFLKADNTIATGSATFLSAEQPANFGANSGLDTYTRLGCFGVAPADAAKVRLVFRAIVRAGDDTSAFGPYMFVTHPFFGEAGEQQTEFSPWAPGNEPQFGTGNKINSTNVTTFIDNAAIQDAQIANLAANKIVATSLSAISANIGLVRTGEILSPDGSVDINLNANVIGITANSFIMRSNTSAGYIQPFAVIDGITYIDNAVIQRGVVTQLGYGERGYYAGEGIVSAGLTFRSGALVSVVAYISGIDFSSTNAASWALYRDGGWIAGGSLFMVTYPIVQNAGGGEPQVVTTGYASTPETILYADTVPGGFHSYSLVVSPNPAISGTGYIARILLTEYNK